MKSRNPIRLAAAFLLSIGVLAVFVTNGPPRILRSGQCEFRVLNDSTGLPVSDAVVSAIWSIRGMEGVKVGFPHVDETLTGEDGRAQFSAWAKLAFTFGEFREGQPEVRVISRNHLPAVVRTSYCQRDIRVRPVEAASEYERSTAADELMDSLWEFYRGKNCEWTKLPLTVRAAEDAYAPYRSVWLDGSRQPPFGELENRGVCGELQVAQ